jgi:hypothetical protein
MSEKSPSIYQRLSTTRSQFHSMKLKKTGHNKFANYFYFELGDFLIPALQIMEQNGIVTVISFGKEMASMKLINIDNPEEVIVIESPMSEANLKGTHAVQNLGAVQTYLRRYLWVAALEIVEHDALDATTGKGDKKVSPVKSDIDLPQEQIEILRDMAQEITELVNEGRPKDALNMVIATKLEAEQHTFLWSQLDSTTRSQLKKAKEL